MRKKVLFIINPISGIQKQKGIEGILQEKCNHETHQFDIRYTEYAGHGKIIARDAVSEGYDIVMAVGGDGTINEVSQHLIGSDTALGIIPAGSGNGLAFHLDIPFDFEKAIDLVNHGSICAIDTATINDAISFIGVSGIGFDAHISHEFSKYGKRGFLSYIKLTLREFFSFHEQNYELIVDSKSIHKNAFLICFANSSQYGNKACIAPGADIKDGLLNIIVLKKLNILKIPFFIVRLFNKKRSILPYIEMLKAKSIIVKNSKGMKYHIDGEPKIANQEIEIKIVPTSLKVLVK